MNPTKTTAWQTTPLDKSTSNAKNTRLPQRPADVKSQRKHPVANIKSAAKRAKQAEKQRQQNISQKSRMRSAVKKVQKAIESGDAAAAADMYKAAVPQIDKIAGKGLIHANKASRHKSRLSKAVKALHS
jgi:small subunit ribosomal protein S20